LNWELKDGDQLMVILKSSPTELAKEQEIKGAGGGPEIRCSYILNVDKFLALHTML
jgi:hypothetical protein